MTGLSEKFLNEKVKDSQNTGTYEEILFFFFWPLWHVGDRTCLTSMTCDHGIEYGVYIC